MCQAKEKTTYYDLAVILYENDKFREAISVLQKGSEVSETFKVFSNVLYQMYLDNSLTESS